MKRIIEDTQLLERLRAIFYSIPASHMHLQDQVADVMNEIRGAEKVKTTEITAVSVMGMTLSELTDLKNWAEEHGWKEKTNAL